MSRRGWPGRSRSSCHRSSSRSPQASSWARPRAGRRSSQPVCSLRSPPSSRWPPCAGSERTVAASGASTRPRSAGCPQRARSLWGCSRPGSRSHPATPLAPGDVVAAGVIAMVAVQALLWFALLRRHGHALRRIDELLSDTDQGGLTVGAAGSGARPPEPRRRAGRAARPAEPWDCRCSSCSLLRRVSPCRSLLPDVRSWQRAHASRLTVAIVSTGGADETRALTESHALTSVLTQEEGQPDELYGLRATPRAVLVGTDGTLAAPVVYGEVAIRELVESRTERSTHGGARGSATRRTRTAVAAAAGAAMTATSVAQATAAPRRHATADDPEVEAFRKTIEAASPSLAKAMRRSSDAVRKALIFEGGSPTRARRARLAAVPAAKALDAERKVLLGLRTRLEALAATSLRAQNVKAASLRGLSLLAESAKVRRRAVLASQLKRDALFAAGDKLQRRGLDSITTSARLIAGKP